jgi:hypothetical protein
MADERDVVVDHYTRGDDEQNRLTQGGSRLEFARTQELLKRFCLRRQRGSSISAVVPVPTRSGCPSRACCSHRAASQIVSVCRLGHHFFDTAGRRGPQTRVPVGLRRRAFALLPTLTSHRHRIHGDRT